MPIADDEDERGVYSKDASIPSYNSYNGETSMRGSRKGHLADEVREDAKEARASKVVCAVLFVLALVVRFWKIGYPDQVV